MKRFEVNKHKRIILYGAAAIGKIMCDKFRAHGFTVKGFIDKRAQEIKIFCGLPVWMLKDVPEELKVNSEVFVYVSVKNVFEHETIAKELTEAKFNKIIYKPYSVLMDPLNNINKQMDVAYENFASDIWQNLDVVPITAMVQTDYAKDYAIISDDGSYVTAFIPVDYVYTNNYTNTPMEKWGNINLLAFFTHLNFFRYLQGDISANYTDYLEEYCLFTANMQGDIVPTEAWKLNVIRNRTQICEQMNISLQVDNDFFIRNAPTAEWNPKGYFNLTSGKHRSTFLAAKGNYLIPLSISKKTYKAFLNESSIHKLLTFFFENKISIESLPIPHPYLYRTTGITKLFYYTFLRVVTKHFAEQLFRTFGTVDFSKLHIFDQSSDLGLFGIFFARMGANLYYGGRKKSLFNEVKIFARIKSKEFERTNKLPDEVNVIFIDLDYIGTIEQKSLNFAQKTVVVICNSHEAFQQFTQSLSHSNGKKIFNTISETSIKEVYICHPEKRIVQ